MKIPSCINRGAGAETPPTRTVRPITAGRGADHGGTLVVLRRPASLRKPVLRGGGVVG